MRPLATRPSSMPATTSRIRARRSYTTGTAFPCMLSSNRARKGEGPCWRLKGSLSLLPFPLSSPGRTLPSFRATRSPPEYRHGCSATGSASTSCEKRPTFYVPATCHRQRAAGIWLLLTQTRETTIDMENPNDQKTPFAFYFLMGMLLLSLIVLIASLML